MRNKGLILFFTILVAVVCLYCLSFSFVTWKVEKDARSYANDPAAISEVVQKAGNNELLKKHLRHFAWFYFVHYSYLQSYKFTNYSRALA